MNTQKYTPKREEISGKYKSTEGKTPKMFEMEKQLCVKFEDDFKRNYKEGNMSQRDFAKRWNSSRTLIFDTSLKKHGRLCWIERVGLEK
ncbi:MAG: hypothetical protein RBS01_03275 [Candidatus Dojkabacteria bacterium]|jgi:hypothetical protein|nr:hypothetical protein [Candidatus Dojkabacteria bacterium]